MDERIDSNISITTVYNIISVAVIQGIAFLMTPFVSRIMGDSQYGKYSVLISWVVILTGVLDLGISNTMGLGLYHFKEEYLKYKSSIILYTILICLAISLIVISGVFFFGKPGVSVSIATLICCMAFTRIVFNIFQSGCIYEKKAKTNCLVSMTLALLTSALSLVGILYFNDKYIWKMIGEFIPYIIVVVLFITYIFVNQRPIFKKDYFIFGISVGSPIIFHELARNVLTQSDRIMMEWMNKSDADIGVYSLFYAMCSVLTFILTALNNSWCPFYYDDIRDKQYEKLEVKTKNYIELFSVLTIGFLFLSREVSYLMGDESYRVGINTIPILVMSVFFTFMYMFPVNYEFYHKKTILVSVGSVLAAIINIIMNYLLIPKYNYMGAAVATTVSYLALFVFHQLCAKYIISKDYYLKVRWFIIWTLTVLFTCFMFYFLKDYIIIRWLIGALIGVIEIVRIYKRKSIF